MRVSRRWLAFTPVLPAAGLLLLLRAGSSPQEVTPKERAPFAGRERASSSSSRHAGREAASMATGHLRAPASVDHDHEGARERAATKAKPPTSALGAALRPLLGKLQQAQEANDDRAIGARLADLSSVIARDPAEALSSLMIELRAASDESEAGVILRVLTEEASLPRPELLAAFSEMARSGELPMHRQIAIHALGVVGDADKVTEVAELGRRDRDSEVRETAAATLGALGDRMPGPAAQSAARELALTLATENDPRVRTSLIYAFRDTREAPAANALLGALVDNDAGVRLAAADMLGDVAAAHRERAVAQLAARFAQEVEKEVRQTIVTAIVRAGRIGAIPVLEKLQGGEVQVLIDDFLAGLRSGEDNMEKLYAVRFAREKARGKP